MAYWQVQNPGPFVTLRADLFAYAGDYDPPQADPNLGNFSGEMGSEYAPIEKVDVLRGLIDTFAVMYPQVQQIDFRQDVSRLNVPVCFFKVGMSFAPVAIFYASGSPCSTRLPSRCSRSTVQVIPSPLNASRICITFLSIRSCQLAIQTEGIDSRALHRIDSESLHPSGIDSMHTPVRSIPALADQRQFFSLACGHGEGCSCAEGREIGRGATLFAARCPGMCWKKLTCRT